MARERVNPFDRGTAAHVLVDHYRRSMLAARAAMKARDTAAIEADAYNAKADQYAKALRALGHGDKLPGPPQAALPEPSERND